MIKTFVKDQIVPEIFARIPFGLLRSVTGVIPLVPYYHGVSDDQSPHVKHLYRFKSVKEFKRDLDLFLREFQILDLRDMIASLKRGQPVPGNSLILQFDDGFREVYDVVAPILWEKGVTATFFLIASCLDNLGMPYSNKVSVVLEHLARLPTQNHIRRISEILADWGISGGADLKTALLSADSSRQGVLDAIANVVDCDLSGYIAQAQPFLSSEQVRSLMRKGFRIGAHSMDHPKYSLLPLEGQLYQTVASVSVLRNRFSLDYAAFAFPHGDDDLADSFFNRIFAGDCVDVSFGNIGKRRNLHPRHYPRVVMEKQSGPPDRIVGRYYAATLCDVVMTRLKGGHDFRHRK